jgi:hypothetical protein
MRIATLSGRITVRTADGLPQPYERFQITLNPDGSRTLRALTVSPGGSLVRDVNAHVTADWRSVSGSSRVFLDGVLQGVVAKFADASVIRSVVASGGQFDIKEFSAPARYSLGFHPIADEAWKMALVETGTNRRQPLVTHTCSPRWNGKTIEHGATVHSEVEYLGEDEVALAGQPARARAYLWHTPFDRVLKIWAHGPHFIFVRLEVIQAPNAGTVYELASLEYEGW